MIDVNNPDFSNTPASAQRPLFQYGPIGSSSPQVSIISPYYNTGPIFEETVRSIEKMSFTNWEWILVDDGSTDAESLSRLEQLEAREPRVRVIHQVNGGPAVARNRAAVEARGEYLFQIDSDDLIEPTFVEKAVWFLATQPQFAACNARTVTFGSREFLWPHGFEEYENCLNENWVTNQAVIRLSSFREAGGYDESISYEHADWDFWLNLAEVGEWGYTIPEYLTWYRVQEKSLMTEIQNERGRDQAFRTFLQKKHGHLATNFPHPSRPRSLDTSFPTVDEAIPVVNPLAKPESSIRVLFIVPWLAVGGSDKFNLDLVQLLSRRGYEFTIATTLRSDHSWMSMFAKTTPDIFCLHQFLNFGDYPRFLCYLIESRQIDAVLISNSELAYSLVPYLRARYPHLAMLDYTHSEVENWKNGGYPGMSVRLGRQLDTNVTSTQHLKQWMVARGADPTRIEVCYCGVDADLWNKAHYDVNAIRSDLTVSSGQSILLYTGRFSAEKRPLTFVKIIEKLAATNPNFVALMIGDGGERGAVEHYVRSHRLEQHIRLLGTLLPDRVREVMAASDILVLPSEVEGLALVLFECMAMETVPVAVNIGGHGELVTADCGYLLARSQHEIDEYVEALSQLLNDPQRRNDMAIRARERVLEGFDLEHLATGIDSAIDRTRRLAAVRLEEKPDVYAMRYSASLAVEYMRMEAVANELWAARSGIPAVGFARHMRERMLPIGSERYEIYKGFRQRLRDLRSALHLLRYRRRSLPPIPREISQIEETSSVDSVAVPTSDPSSQDSEVTIAQVSPQDILVTPQNETSFESWQKELPTEVAFWDYWIREANIPWQEERRARLDPNTPLQDWVRDLIDIPEGSPVHLLDVGAGPATQLGRVWPGREVSITAIDPLANEYNNLFAEHGIAPPVRTQQCHGEHILEMFRPNSFDFACSFNALDHSYDPLAVIQQMVEVVKPGCLVFLQHFVNEAEQEEYQGLHQWNFTAENGQFVIWNSTRRIAVADALPLAAEIRTVVDTGEEKDGLRVFIRKREQSPNRLPLSEFAPLASLVTHASMVAQPRYPVVDAHNHLGELVPGKSFSGDWPQRPVSELVEELDAAEVHALVDLDGGFGDKLRREIARYREPYPDRFIVFAGIDYDAFSREPDIGKFLGRQLRESASLGAQGLKIWKTLGLHARDTSGKLIAVDDRRLDELWATAGELKLPVLIHVADPVAFFQPHDRFNERWEELEERPEWRFSEGGYPAFAILMEQLESLVSRHRATTFIGAHVGCYAENLQWVGRMLDSYPNFYVDIAARLNELGRQPHAARRFFIQHSDRILFGTDSPPDQRVYRLHYRYLETDDEYFNYGIERTPTQGRWAIYGISLPDEVLRCVYSLNAAHLLNIELPR